MDQDETRLFNIQLYSKLWESKIPKESDRRKTRRVLKMSKLFLSADYHFGHENIIKYCKRPFKDVTHMTKRLVTAHNQRVKPEDTFIHVGDFCFRNSPGGKKGEGETTVSEEYLAQLNGRIVLIKGNHDKNNKCKAYIDGCEITWQGQKLWICHDPAERNTAYRINLVGHVHEAWKFKRIGGVDCINVGCDVWNYMPVTLEEVMRAYDKWVKLGRPTR
jgi:calcineurin-like phosphoesterase family protein